MVARRQLCNPTIMWAATMMGCATGGADGQACPCCPLSSPYALPQRQGGGDFVDHASVACNGRPKSHAIHHLPRFHFPQMKSSGRRVRSACTPLTTCRPRLKRLIKSLQQFSVTSSEHVELFSNMTLRDFGFYVSDADAMRYVADEAYPIAERAFQLENALHQHRLSAITAQVSPMTWKSSSNDTLGCSTLYQDEAVTLCWFVLPPGKVLPLHDHPGMTVWQRAMHGRLHLCSITREAVSQTSTGASTAPINATVVFDGELDGVGDAIPASDVLGFTPTDGDGGGMLHEIRNIDATQPALFVDIISPPYNQAPSSIACGYYTAEPLDATATLLPALAADCGVRHQLKAGDKVRLHPRTNYSGPAMNAFLQVV